jgi:hypothetical protein
MVAIAMPLKRVVNKAANSITAFAAVFFVILNKEEVK